MHQHESNVPAKKGKIRLVRRDTIGDWLIGKLVRLPCDDRGNYCTGTLTEFEEERNVDDSNSGKVARVTFSDGSSKSVNFDESAKAAFAHLLEDYPVENRMMWPDSTPPSMAKPSIHRRKTKGTKSKGKDLRHLDASKKTSRVEKTKTEAEENLKAPSNLERKSGLSIWVQNGKTQHPAYELIDMSNSSSDCEFIWVEWLSNGEIERVQSHQVTRVLPRRSRRKTARYI